MSDLRSRIIRLAHSRPDLRPALLPLLKESASRVAGKPHKWLLDNPEANRLFNQILGEVRKTDWEPYLVALSLEILENSEIDDLPRTQDGELGISGEYMQYLYEKRKDPFNVRMNSGTINFMMEAPRIKSLIFKYIEAAEKTGVSARDAADELDQTAFNVFVDVPNPIIFKDFPFEDRHKSINEYIDIMKETAYEDAQYDDYVRSLRYLGYPRSSRF